MKKNLQCYYVIKNNINNGYLTEYIDYRQWTFNANITSIRLKFKSKMEANKVLIKNSLQDVAHIIKVNKKILNNKLNIYHIYQLCNKDLDVYHMAIVISDSVKNAKYIHPEGTAIWSTNKNCWVYKDDSLGGEYHNFSWVNPDEVIITLLGKATSGLTANQVICSINNSNYSE